MGNRNNKSNQNTNWILCDENGIILDISDIFLKRLMFEKEIIVGSFIGIIMSPLISFLHKNFFIPKYKSLNKLEKNIVNLMLMGKTKERPLIIYDILLKPYYVLLSVNYDFKKHNFIGNFELQEDIYDFNLCPTLKNHNLTSDIIKSTNKLIIITMKITYVNMIHVNDSNIINMQFEINMLVKNIINIIKTYYYPYIHVYNIDENFITFLLNCDWGYNISKYIASLSVSFIYKLMQLANQYISLRFGVVFNNVYYNYEDKFKIYGKTNYLSKRLSIISIPNFIYSDENYIDKLINENVFDILDAFIEKNNNINIQDKTFEINPRKIMIEKNMFTNKCI